MKTKVIWSLENMLLKKVTGIQMLSLFIEEIWDLGPEASDDLRYCLHHFPYTSEHLPPIVLSSPLVAGTSQNSCVISICYPESHHWYLRSWSLNFHWGTLILFLYLTVWIWLDALQSSWTHITGTVLGSYDQFPSPYGHLTLWRLST